MADSAGPAGDTVQVAREHSPRDSSRVKTPVEAPRIKGLKETTHGYKKNETKRMISRANCNTMFLFFSYRRQSDLTKCPLMISQCKIMISRLA